MNTITVSHHKLINKCTYYIVLQEDKKKCYWYHVWLKVVAQNYECH